MRDLYNVIADILKEIPKTDENSATREVLGKIQDSVSYSAPEAIGFWWEEFVDFFNSYITRGKAVDELEDWEQRALCTFMDVKDVSEIANG